MAGTRRASLAVLALAAALLAATADAAKVLCLHGGGQPASAFQMDPGMQALQASFPSVEFVFAQAPTETSVWLRDPTGGKGEPTTDPNWAADSLAVLDQVVQAQGPFTGILGYSQGSAMVPVYLAHAPQGTFSFAAMFCGYLTETHQGVLGNVQSASPFGNIPGLVWMGTADSIISNAMSQEQATVFTSPTVVVSQGAGHAVPSASDSTYSQVVSFIESHVTSAGTPAPAPSPTSGGPTATPPTSSGPTATPPTSGGPTATPPPSSSGVPSRLAKSVSASTLLAAVGFL